MSPWLIVTTVWPAVTVELAPALARAVADPATLAGAATCALLLAGAVLLRRHTRERRQGRSARSTS